MIEFQDVTVCYEPDKRHPVRSLDGVSLKIERGDWVFLVGPSGAGKSSLLRLIYAGMKAQSGRVLVEGEDISNISPRAVPILRRKIGIVFQDFQLLSEKTAWENIAFALRVIGTPQSVIVREVPRALETVGLTHRAEALPHELSGGEQQRIAIARALVNNPPILLTDEPTGNLDPQTARDVGQLLTKINFERGTTIVMATHDGAFVDEMARRVVRLKAGHIVSDCNPGIYGDDSEEIAPFLQPQPLAPPVVQPPIVVASPSVAPIVVETPRPAPVVVPEVVVSEAIPEVSVPEVAVPTVVVPEVPPEVVAVTSVEEPVVEELVGQQPIVNEPIVNESILEQQVVAISAEVVSPATETPTEVPVEDLKMEEVEAAVALPEAEEIAPKPEEPVVASGNWAQIAATTAKKPVSNPVTSPLDPYSVDGVQPKIAPRPMEEELVTRPMARRIAPPVPPPQNGYALQPPVADPSAPLGSPENPIVQYE